ncbi:uncharacterized protein [Henckelia pumila]|uniref:uncharacterized protein n=1 Tax=Henckelia pumila TaxID=405737 RepID=UPI003C6E32AE
MGSEIVNVRARPLSLKDYLLDDMSSCSSNGFASFPRRQCCTTVRYLLDIELMKNQQQNQPDLLKSPSKSALTAFQYVIAAVKRLPFAAGRLPEAEKPKKSMLARSISKKIINKSASTFWRRKKPNEKEIQRLKSFDELLKEDPVSSDRSEISTTDGSDDCWPGTDTVPAAAEECSSGNPKFTEVDPVGENVVVEVPLEDKKKASNGETMDVPQSHVWGGSATTSSDGSGSITDSKEKLWSTEEKEQLSPVSVLDCPFDDEDDEVSSPYGHRVAHVEETKKKLMKKIQRFESLAELEPLNLTERFALQPESDKESAEWPQERPYESNNDKSTSEIVQKEDEDENDNKAMELLHQFKHNHPSYGPKVKVESLVFDFFRERITNERVKRGGSSVDEEVLLEEVEVWINGQNHPHEPFLGWGEVKANRQSYINDMEKDGTWKTLDQENTEVALDLETEIFHALLNEMC